MKHFRVFISALIVIACTGFGGGGKEATPKNYFDYYGQVTDNHGKTIKVENITISDKQRDIKLYDVPADQLHDPAESITVIDLNQIYAIEPAPHEKCPFIHFKSKEYNKVIITLRDDHKTQQVYLLPTSEKLKCEQTTGAGALPRQFTFNGMKKLVIEGKHEHTYQQLYPQNASLEVKK